MARRTHSKRPNPRAKAFGSALPKGFELFEPSPSALRSGPKELLRARGVRETAGLSRGQLLEVYRFLFETRRLEEHLVALYRQNKVIGGVYRSLGQEATAVGCTYALRDGDFIQPLIRDLGAEL